jgi:ABC-2 type transport system permease protein
MSRVVTAFWNPIVAKEYRSRMRTWRSPLAMMIYILLIAGLGYAIFTGIARSINGFNGQAANYGQTLFTYLVLFQMILLTFITPALTAGAISGERERQTIDLLFVTRIPPFSMIWGKALASMSFVALLLLLSVPIFSLVFLFGGIELDQVVYAFVVTIITALTLGLMGIAFSTLFQRTLAATVVAYVAAFVLVFGVMGYGLIFPTLVDSNSNKVPSPPAVTYLSPIIPLFSIANNGWPYQSYGVRYPNSGVPFQQGGPGSICQTAPDGSTSCYSTGVTSGPIAKGGYVGPGQYPQTIGAAIPSGLFEGWQYWQATILMQLAICLLALLVSAVMLPPVRRLPWRRRSATTTS